MAIASVSLSLADFRMERELDLAPGGRFIIDTDAGSVSVEGGSRSGVRVVVTAKNEDIEDRFDFRFEEDGDEARVLVDKKGSLSFWKNWSSGGLKFEVQVPSRVQVTVDTAGGGIRLSATEGDALLDTSGGGIHVSDVVGDVEADTSGGGIDVSDVDGDVNLDTSGGAIRVEGVSGDVRADTSGGGITVRDARGYVHADTSGGPISASFAPGNDRGGLLSTSGGGIRVELDSNVSLTVDAASSGGSVTSDVPVTVSGKVSRNSLRGEINGGGETLKLRTSGGSIKISEL